VLLPVDRDIADPELAEALASIGPMIENFKT